MTVCHRYRRRRPRTEILAAAFLGAACALFFLVPGDPVLAQQPAPPSQADTSDAQAGRQSAPAAAAMFRSAVALQNRGLYDLAAQDWESLIAQHENDPLAAYARHYLGVCRFQLGQYAEAEAALARVLSNGPPAELAEATYANLGLAQYNRGVAADNPAQSAALDEAAATFAEQLRRFPDGDLARQARFYSAEALYTRGKVAEAAAEYQRFVAGVAEHALRPQALYGLGVAQQELQEHQAAAETFAAFAREFPQHELLTEVTLRHGEALSASGQIDQAAEKFAVAAAAEGFAEADYAQERQAAAAYAQQDFAEAAGLYASLVERFPQSDLAGTATLAAGKAFYSAGDYDNAAVWLDRALGSGGENASDAAHWLARSLLQMEEHERALAVADGALRTVQPDDPLAIELKLDRADALSRLPGRAKEASAAYEETAREHAEHELAPKALYLAAYSSLQAEDFPRVRELAGRFAAAHAGHEFAADVRLLAADATLRLADAERTAGRPAEALALLASLDAPADWEQRDAVLLITARAQHEGGNTEAAVATLDRLLRDFPDSEVTQPAMILRADCLRQAGSTEEAIAAYQAVLERRPADNIRPAIHSALASLHAARENWPEAAAAAEQVISAGAATNEQQAAAYLLRATARERQQQYAEALADVERILTMNTPARLRSDALVLRGKSQAGQRDFAAAAATFREVLEGDPNYAVADRVLYDLAWAYFDQGETGQATATFTRLATEHGDSPLAAEAWFRVGEAQYDAGDFAAAEASYGRALAAAAGAELSTRAAHKRGWALFKQEKYDEALAAFREQLAAGDTGPLAADARLMQGEALYQQEKHSEALAAFTEGLQAAPADGPNAGLRATSLLHAGQAAAHEEKWEQSLALLRQGLAEHPASGLENETRYEAGWALYNLQRPEEAQQLFDAVAAADTTVVGARAGFMSGEIHFAQKRHQEAVRTFFKVAYGYGDREAPEPFHHWQAESMFEAARCLEVLDRVDAAGDLYRELLERFPNSEKTPHARNRLGEIGG